MKTEEIIIANIVSNIYDSVIDYECPCCETIRKLEPDAGVVTCECGIKLMCDVIECCGTFF